VNAPSEIGEPGRQLLDLFQGILAILPPRTAKLEVKRTGEADVTLLKLIPRDKSAAVFGVQAKDNLDLVDVIFGLGSKFGLPWEGMHPKVTALASILVEVREMCLAVVDGRCEERLGFIGRTGIIRVDEQHIYRTRRFFYPRLIPKTVKYAPYFSGYPSSVADARPITRPL
jgi:hypothetical protein